ncbi:hypothetical protein [Leifsonia sp. AG29]|uniref:hypothetical protein n=1 Tax=Leifsonia sp. AG29 TaxID=2598860 RepID=UPI00131B2411|nr:hypothetical protein [Leifsonia sp. AG29]
MRRSKIAAGITVAFAMGTTLVGFAPAEPDSLTASEALAAVNHVAPEVLEQTIGSPNGTGESDAMRAEVGGTDISLPVTASGGIEVSTGSHELTIGLPYSDQARPAAEVHTPGVVVYDNRNGSSTVPAIQSDGSIRISTVLADPGAPKRYDYPMDLGPGERLRANPDHSIDLVASDGTTLGHFDAPWAKDADGNPVPTWYEVKGDTLTQMVDFSTEAVFPIVADPTYKTYVITYSRADVEQMWKMINNINNICHFVPLPYLGSIACSAPAALSSAVSQAHYQSKRVRATYWDCGYNYCSYYTYAVVS